MINDLVIVIIVITMLRKIISLRSINTIISLRIQPISTSTLTTSNLKTKTGAIKYSFALFNRNKRQLDQ
jgi:hypothetical protein